MRYLIAETVSLKPHLETAGELALQLQSEGHEVVFSCLGENLPWSDWHLPAFARWLGCSLDKREKRFVQLLTEHKISVVSPDHIANARMQELEQWAQSFQGNIDTLKHYHFEDAALGMGVASSLISFYGNSHYNPSQNYNRAHKCLLSAAIVFERAKMLIKQISPDFVISFNGRFATTKPIMIAAQNAGIPFLRHERGATFDRYEIFSDAIHNYAYIRSRISEAWDQADPITREELGHMFFRRRREGDGIGWYSYTADQQRGTIPPRVAGKRRIVYFSSSDDEYAAVTDVFTPGPWPDQLTAVHAMLEAVSTQSDVELIIRIHPHLAKKSSFERAQWLSLAQPAIHLIHPEEKIDSYALLDSADIVISYGSTIGIEAAYWKKPSILIGPCSYAGSPAVVEPKTVGDIRLLIQPGYAPPTPNQAHCLPYGHYYLSYGKPFRYYQPTSLSEGTFLGDRLGWDPDWLHALRQKSVVKKISRMLLRRK